MTSRMAGSAGSAGDVAGSVGKRREKCRETLTGIGL